MKRMLVLLMAVVMLLAFAACTQAGSQSTSPASEPTTEPAIAGYTPGDYEATVNAMKGPLTVMVSVSEDAITAVTVTAHEDTVGIADAAIDRIPEAIVDGQTLAVDTVTGATVTSGAILSAASEALTQAGADVSALKQAGEKPALIQGEELSVDIVIVGAGGAGLSAAAMATRDSDLNVLVLEKLAYTGGSTRVAGGAIWMRGTQYNTEVDFDAAYLVEFMEQRSGVELNRDLLTNIANVIPDTMDYYFEKGVPLNTESNSLGHPDSKLFTLSPPNSSGGNGGAQMSEFLNDLALSTGAEVRTDSVVTELIVENGAVIGVKVKDLTSEYTVKAKKVILATGGFTRNESMIEEYAPFFTNNIPFTGAGSLGDGITLTEELDTIVVGEGMMGLKTLNPNLGYYGPIGGLANTPGVLFNEEGNRFANERVFYSEITYPLNEQTDKRVYGIVDSTSERVPDLDTAVEMGLVYKADTLEALAEAAGMDVEAFVTNMQAYNDVKKSGKDDPDFGVANDRMVSIEQAPFYAVPIRPGFIGSIPGLQVNGNTEVLTSSGEVIPNLYACGELTFGNMFSKWYPASGSGVGFALYSGAISGEQAKESLEQ